MNIFKKKDGMELIQAAILIAVAVGLGIIFKSEITSFVNETFSNLDASNF
ncbi:MAG TPA: Flp1 family type IVb pilin [Anaerovoracaceae bacterium]|nr:Flp1 family type IVb pilin [Anaerovoracaceae bacterium]